MPWCPASRSATRRVLLTATPGSRSWVVDFPMFDYDEESALGRRHHPFTSPKDETSNYWASNPASARESLDLALNGWELAAVGT